MERRTFLEMTGAGMVGATGYLSREQESRSGILRTRLTDLLGLEYPIIQSGMGRVAGPELAAEVSNAGGLGILAGLGLPADELRRQIARTRELTDRPFGVNLWLHPELQPPADASKLPEGDIRAAQEALNGFRKKLGIAETFSRPQSFPDTLDECFRTVLEERVPVWSIGLGDPGRERVRECRERGIRVMAMAATVEDARALASSGVDVLVAQGGEAGGHRSTWVKTKSRERANIGTMTLVPQIVDAVDVPVVAAGGIADGRGLVAALALGAAGILMGTRFVAARESMAPDIWKKALLEGGSDETTVTDAITGLYARAIRNAYTEEYEASGAPVLPGLLQAQAAQDIFQAAVKQSNPQYFPLMSGQSVGLIRDLPGAREIVDSVVRKATETLKAMAELARNA